MRDIQSPRRRRNQPEIDQLVREVRTSGLNQREFAHKIVAHSLTVTLGIRTSPMDVANPPISSAARDGYPTSSSRFVAVKVRQNLTSRESAGSTPGDLPEFLAPNGWRLGGPLGAEFAWVGELLAQLLLAELPLEHTGLPRSQGHGFEEVLRLPGGVVRELL